MYRTANVVRNKPWISLGLIFLLGIAVLLVGCDGGSSGSGEGPLVQSSPVKGTPVTLHALDARGEWSIDFGNEFYGYTYLLFTIPTIETWNILQENPLPGVTHYLFEDVTCLYEQDQDEYYGSFDIEFVWDGNVLFIGALANFKLWDGHTPNFWIQIEGCGEPWHEYLEETFGTQMFFFDSDGDPDLCGFLVESNYTEKDPQAMVDQIQIEQLPR
jgi:hypothetical protein